MSGDIRQNIDRNTGNLVAAPNATFLGSFSQGNIIHHHAPDRPQIDLSPSVRQSSLIRISTLLNFSFITTSIGIVSGLLGMFGTDLFKLSSALTEYVPWVISIPFGQIGIVLFGTGIVAMGMWFKSVKLGHPSFGRWPFVQDEHLHWIVARRVCPFCHGTMLPKKDVPSGGRPQAKWECSRNPNHTLPYDPTEVEDAILQGDLRHLINDVV